VNGVDAQPGAQPVDVREDLPAQRPLARPARLSLRPEQVGELVLQPVRLVELRGEL